jgi:lipopolysaccharide/colanic/teichoic acid biosynthesis glycosyltransferase
MESRAMRYIYSTKEFRRVLEKEYDRSNRNDYGFSIVVFDTKNLKSAKFLTSHLSNILNHRVRSSDNIGWIDQKRLGLILPDTSVSGARKIAEDVCSRITPKAFAFTYKIITYPDHWIFYKKERYFQSKVADIIPQPNGTISESQLNLIKELGPLLPTRMPPYSRFLDIILTLLGSILLAPVLLFIAIFIKIVSPGPVLFKQERVGYLGKTFTLWKFRTMKKDADNSLHLTHTYEFIKHDKTMKKLDEEDLRIIPFGKFMRRTGLDELPQLFNVLRGEMSLIGPRPCTPYEASQYLNWQYKRFDTAPGITGLWQVSGKNRTTFNEMMRFDITYAKKKTFLMDLKILFKTFPVIISQLTDKKAEREKAS